METKKEHLEQLVGKAFEDLSLEEMYEDQGSGDIETELLPLIKENNIKVIKLLKELFKK